MLAAVLPAYGNGEDNDKCAYLNEVPRKQGTPTVVIKRAWESWYVYMACCPGPLSTRDKPKASTLPAMGHGYLLFAWTETKRVSLLCISTCLLCF